MQRQIHLQYYHRVIKTLYEDVVRKASQRMEVSEPDRLEYIRNPVIAEFLG